MAFPPHLIRKRKLCEPSLLAVWENAKTISDKPRRSSRTNRQASKQHPTQRSATRAFKQIKRPALLRNRQIERTALGQDCYRDPIGAGGTGASSRSAFVERRDLLTRDSLPGLFLLSLPTSAGFFASSAFFDGAAGLNAVGWGAISGVVLAPALGRGHEKSSARPAGAAKTSPRLKTFVAIESDVICV
jgi:hypothetical protein